VTKATLLARRICSRRTCSVAKASAAVDVASRARVELWALGDRAAPVPDPLVGADVDAYVDALLRTGGTLLDADNRERGLQLLDHAVAVAEERGSSAARRSANQRLGEHLGVLGEWADAEEAYRSALKAAAEELQTASAGPAKERPFD
jgi:tetratricopeptide (TPR) repeat protein